MDNLYSALSKSYKSHQGLTRRQKKRSKHWTIGHIRAWLKCIKKDARFGIYKIERAYSRGMKVARFIRMKYKIPFRIEPNPCAEDRNPFGWICHITFYWDR